MRKRQIFDERWEQEERNYKRMQRFAIGFIITVFLLIIAVWTAQGVLVYKFIDNPEMFGSLVNKFLNSMNGS